MNNSMLAPTQKSGPGSNTNYTPDNIIGTLSNMQDVQTDLNVDLIKRSDSLMDIHSPPDYNRRGRMNNNRKGAKSRSRSPMGASQAQGNNLYQGNPYEYTRPSSKGRQAKKGRKGRRGTIDDDLE